MNFGDVLLASLATSRTVVRKRTHASGEEPSSSSDAGRPAKRARLNNDGGGGRGGLPPGLGLALDSSVASVADEEGEDQQRGPHQQRREDVAGGGGGGADDNFFVPLDQASKRARRALIKRLIAEEEDEHTCFFCDFVKRYDQEKKRVGGQREVLLDGSYAYELAIKLVHENPNWSVVKKARGIMDIYKLHVYDKAVRALGGQKPTHLPEPRLEEYVRHILDFNYDQVSLTKEALDTARDLVQAFKSQLVSEGKANEKNGRMVLMANQQFYTITKDMARLREARGIPDGPFVMDAQKLMSFADTRPIEAFRKDSEGLGIGGATATNTAVETQRVTARRPAFGGLVTEDGEEEEEEEDEEL